MGVAGQSAESVFLLVHSPLVGPATWAPVARELERHRREVLVPSLRGVADAPPPQWRHAVETVLGATEHVPRPVVLVGHSGAGPLLPVIAGVLPGGVAALIFVDSFLPPPSGSMQLADAELMLRLRQLAQDGVLPRWSSWFGDEAIRELVPDPEMRAQLEHEMPRLPLAYFEDTVPMPGSWSERRCAYVLLSPDPYAGAADDARARGWPVAEIPDAHHLSAITDPAAIAGALLLLELELAINRD